MSRKALRLIFLFSLLVSIGLAEDQDEDNLDNNPPPIQGGSTTTTVRLTTAHLSTAQEIANTEVQIKENPEKKAETAKFTEAAITKKQESVDKSQTVVQEVTHAQEWGTTQVKESSPPKESDVTTLSPEAGKAPIDKSEKKLGEGKEEEDDDKEDEEDKEDAKVEIQPIPDSNDKDKDSKLDADDQDNSTEKRLQETLKQKENEKKPDVQRKPDFESNSNRANRIESHVNRYPDQSDESSFFTSVFLVATLLVICLFLLQHNKKKILGLIFEGRSSGSNRRSNIRYRRLSQEAPSN